MTKMIISDEYRDLKQDYNKSRSKHNKNILFKRVILLVALITIFIIAVSVFSSNTFGSSNGHTPIEITVKEGDCLWDIAKEYSNGKDIRKVVYDIKKYNNMDDSNLYPGMIILIPET